MKRKHIINILLLVILILIIYFYNNHNIHGNKTEWMKQHGVITLRRGNIDKYCMKCHERKYKQTKESFCNKCHQQKNIKLVQ